MISGSIGYKLTKSNDSHGLNDMNKMTANQAKTHFGELLLQTQREPVQITKNGKPAAVVLSAEDYASNEELKLQLLQLRAAQAEKDVASGLTTDGDAFLSDLSQQD